jgi:hypothetical protein
MAQDLADLRKRHAASDHLARDGMAETVRTNLRQACSRAGPPNDRGDAATSDCHERCLRCYKDLAAGCFRSTMLEVVGNRLANIVRERQAAVTAPFAQHHHLRGAPVDVLEPQFSNFAGAQT